MRIIGLTGCRRGSIQCLIHSFRRVGFVADSSAVDAGMSLRYMRSYAAYSILREVADESEKGVPKMSLAKSLACLPDESSIPAKRKIRTRMELKRSIELRIKKRVKEQYLNGRFYDLMEKVIANANTLQDSYDIIRLNSNVELSSKSDDLCFLSMAEQLASGDFDTKANVISMSAKSGRTECLVLPNLKLKVIQEAIRIVLEVVYRPHFSKISHGCRSGRGHQSALRYICKEVHNPDWWFTLCVNKEADQSILSRLISEMEEKIEDAKLFFFIHCMFDAQVLNLEFGGLPKGHGLPQEGVLAPILMNIYLDIFDREVCRIFMRYEGLGPYFGEAKDGKHSKLRQWFRRQMKDREDNNDNQLDEGADLRLHACRYMDEIIISVSGSKDVALSVKAEIRNYLKHSLYLDVEGRMDILAVNNRRGVQFLGTVVRMTPRECDTVRAVHKLKDKVRLFASQKQEIWDAGTVRIGKKWLAYGLKKIKESEIKQLGLSTPLLDKISYFRKEGMKTDHWFKSLLKVWIQDVNAKVEANEELVLSNYIAEPALPQDLRDAFYNFQEQAKEYVSSETASTLALLSSSSIGTGSAPSANTTITKIEAPINSIKKSLMRYGLINIEGFPRHVSALILQDDILIIHWFSGLVRRWLKWFSEFDNFAEIKLMIVECVKKSCIRTLAAKHRMQETAIEKRFEFELSGIPMAEELEFDMTAIASESHRADDDEALMYGISYSGLCMLSLSRVKVPSRLYNCFVMGCPVASPSMYALHVRERQRFPGWKTGFTTAIHPSLNGKRIGLCNQHVKDLYLGHISLQSIEFGALSR